MNARREGLSLFLVLLVAAFGFIAIAGGGFMAFRYWRQQQQAQDADFNRLRP